MERREWFVLVSGSSLFLYGQLRVKISISGRNKNQYQNKSKIEVIDSLAGELAQKGITSPLRPCHQYLQALNKDVGQDVDP